MKIETQNLIFGFGEHGMTPVVLFHPPKAVGWSDTRVLFVPRSGCQDVRVYGPEIEAVVHKESVAVYALEFRGDAEAGVRRPTPADELRLISGAILWLRGQGIKVIACTNLAMMAVLGSPFFRKEHDQATHRRLP